MKTRYGQVMIPEIPVDQLERKQNCECLSASPLSVGDLKPCDHSPFLLSFLGRPCINLVPTHIDGPKLLNRRLLNHKNNSSFCWVPSLMNQLLKRNKSFSKVPYLFLSSSKQNIHIHTHTPSGSA